MSKLIFISHAQNDKIFADKICEKLETNGYSCWIAPRDIPYGTDWAGEIASSIKACRMFVFLLSSSSVDSRQCPKEITLADSAGKPMLCVQMDGTAMNPMMEYHFLSAQLCRYDPKDPTRTLNELLATAQRILGPAPVRRTAAAPSQQPPQRTAPPQQPPQRTAPSQGARQTAYVPPKQNVNVPQKGNANGSRKAAPRKKMNFWKSLILSLFAGLIVMMVSSFLNSEKSDTKTQRAASSAVKISDELFDFEFVLQDVAYRLPFELKQLTENGWTEKENNFSLDKHSGGKTYEGVDLEKNGKKISVFLLDPRDGAASPDTCRVGGISCDLSSGVSFRIAKGITCDSSLEEVQEKLGAPDDRQSFQLLQKQTVLTYRDKKTDTNLTAANSDSVKFTFSERSENWPKNVKIELDHFSVE